MKRDKATVESTAPKVEPVDYTPTVGSRRHLVLTLPKSAYSSYGGRHDTSVTLSADEADDLAAKLTTAAAELRARA